MTDKTHPYPSYPYHRDSPYDPPPEFSLWRTQSPISKLSLWDGRTAWLVTGLDEVRTVLRDHDTFSSLPTAAGFPSLNPADAGAKAPGMMQLTDPPLHEVLRRAVQGEFTVKRVAERRVETETIVTDLLDAIEARGGPVDLLSSLCAPVPAQFTCRQLGVPLTDAPFFAASLSQRFDHTAEQVSSQDADQQLVNYFAGVVDDRRSEFRDDLSGRLVRDHVQTGDLTAAQAARILHVLLIAGFDTTKNMLAMSTILLLNHPDELARLQTDPARWAAAIEEMLRYLSVVQYQRRAVIRPVDIAGQRMEPGDGVLTALHAANRDPRAFDMPNRVDFERSHNIHLAVGSGIHQCLGQPVARMTLQVTIPRLFERFQALRLAIPANELVYNEGQNIWGPRELPVTW
jgi:cytochrome P450